MSRNFQTHREIPNSLPAYWIEDLANPQSSDRHRKHFLVDLLMRQDSHREATNIVASEIMEINPEANEHLILAGRVFD